jgi:hypothetical protein
MKRLLATIFCVALLAACGGHEETPPLPSAPLPPTPPAPPPVPGQPTDVLARSMQVHAQQLAPGMMPATPLFRGRLETTQTQDFQAVLQPGKCFKIIGVGGEGVTDLDLYLFDPNGVALQQDTETDAYPILGLESPICPQTAGQFRVQVRMYQGTGDFAVQVFATQG